MPAALSAESGRTWWSLSRAPSSKDVRQKVATQSSGKFNSLVSVLGLKPKKQPPVRPPSPRPVSLQPPTPLTADLHRHSLLTLSDIDPFAGRPIAAKDARVSYASSSSNSNPQPTLHLIQSMNPLSPSTRSTSDLIPVRPKPRARGLTDGGSTHKAGFFVEERTRGTLSRKSSASTFFSVSQEPHDPTSPRVVIQAPPSAPPSHRLPPPPTLFRTDNLSPCKLPTSNNATGSASSSSISLTNQIVTLNQPEKRSFKRSLFSQTTSNLVSDISATPSGSKEFKPSPTTPRTLKKAISHQSLRRAPGPASPPPTPKLTPTESIDKVFRKQRSFHHPRLPIPSIPLSMRASISPVSPSFPSPPDPVNTNIQPSQKKPSTTSLGRRRLFSNSSNRPSTSPPIRQPEEDSRSLFSLRSDSNDDQTPLTPLRPRLGSSSATSSNTSSSFWDENADVTPTSPVRLNSEYTPQAIMSKAELAKLEASVESIPEIQHKRPRGFSLLSASTLASDLDRDSDALIGLSPPPPSRSNPKQSSLRMSSNSFASRSSATLVLSEHASSADYSSLMSTAMRPSSPSQSVMTSLPPPPRRQRSAMSQSSDIRDTSHPLSLKMSSSLRSKSTVEIALHRRSIMRKPSFLNLDDDTDQDTDPEIDDGVTGSFLDLARESFDTVRSGDS